MTRSEYNRLPVTIDIGHQTQGHNRGSDEPSHVVSLSMVFLGTQIKAIGAVIFEIRPSCHEISALLF